MSQGTTFKKQLARQQYFRERLTPFDTALFVNFNTKMVVES